MDYWPRLGSKPLGHKKSFPTKEGLDKIFPANPVLLTRIDGHAAIANQQALNLAGVNTITQINGGQIEMKNGALTGVLVDNAVGLVGAKNTRANYNANKRCIAGSAAGMLCRRTNIGA